MNERWKIKVREDQHLYKRCNMILVSASFIRNWVQPPQTIYTDTDSFLPSCHSNVTEFNRVTFNLLSVRKGDIHLSIHVDWRKSWAYTELFLELAHTVKGQRLLANILLEIHCSQQPHHRYNSSWIQPSNALIQHTENCICKATVYHKH